MAGASRRAPLIASGTAPGCGLIPLCLVAPSHRVVPVIGGPHEQVAHHRGELSLHPLPLRPAHALNLAGIPHGPPPSTPFAHACPPTGPAHERGHRGKVQRFPVDGPRGRPPPNSGFWPVWGHPTRHVHSIGPAVCAALPLIALPHPCRCALPFTGKRRVDTGETGQPNLGRPPKPRQHRRSHRLRGTRRPRSAGAGSRHAPLRPPLATPRAMSACPTRDSSSRVHRVTLKGSVGACRRYFTAR